MVIIKPGKEMNSQISMGLSLTILGVFGLCLFGVWECVLIGGIFLLALTPYAISSTRTFEMDASGCTVRWFRYEKFYRWDEFELKQYVHYKGVSWRGSRSPCFRAAEFCPKNVKIPKRLDGHAYSALFHPLSFVFVYFPEKTWKTNADKITQEGYPIIYEADEDLFRAKLREWGVEMAEVNRGVFADDEHWHETID